VKVIYKPFALMFGVVGGVLAKKLFERVWGLFDRGDPPAPNVKQTSWSKVLAAAAVEGLTFKVTRAAVDRAGARCFERLTGVWPGPRESEPDSE
jgi:hypothetical protein